MQAQAVFLLGLVLPHGQVETPQVEKIPNGVAVHIMPREDITLMFIEAAEGMTVRLDTENSGWVEKRKLYIGDGAIAVELAANNFGIWMQQTRKFSQGDKFLNGSLLKVRPGYKLVSQLKPGDVYAVLSGVTFVEPGMLEAEWAGHDENGRAISLSFGADKAVELSIGDDVSKGTYAVAWYREKPSELDLDFGNKGKLLTIMEPNRSRLRIEPTKPGAERPSKFTNKAIVLSRQSADE